MFGFVCIVGYSSQANYHIDHHKFLCWESICNEPFAYSKMSIILFAVDHLNSSAPLPFCTSTLLPCGNHCSSPVSMSPIRVVHMCMEFHDVHLMMPIYWFCNIV